MSLKFNLMKNKIFYSVKSRYAAVSFILTILVFASAVAGYKIVSNSQQEATKNETHRNYILENNQLLRNTIWNSRESLQDFLLEPGNTKSQQNIHDELSLAKTQITRLTQTLSQSNDNLARALETLENDIDALTVHTKNIIETRLNAQKQYPALSIARKVMLPNQNKFYTAVELALTEIVDATPDKHHHDIYQDYDRARQLWSNLISNFRMYFANRIGSLSERKLIQQENSNTASLNKLELILNKIEEHQNKGKLGRISSSSLLVMRNSLEEWKNGYLEVEKIHRSNAWRTDKTILLNHIKPLYVKIWISVEKIDNYIKELASKDITALTNISTVQLKFIQATAVAALIFILFGYLVLNKSILEPISILTNALKEESSGNMKNPLPVPNAKETENLLVAFTTMQTELRAQQKILKHQAMHDSLTGLANRNLMSERVKHVIAIAKRHKKNPALIMMDLDGFKNINDTLGHEIGDKLLIAIGKRLNDMLRETDTVARLGGDEFAVLVDDISEENVSNLANKILNEVKNPYTINNSQLHISSSIGISLYPIHGDSETLLTQHADVAMYHAKRNSLGTSIYDPKIDKHTIEKLSLVADLRSALKNNELDLYFQPKICLKTNKTKGLEALLRWNHPTNGFIPPDKIIALAEQSGQVNDIFEWVFNQSSKYTKQWQKNRLNINVAVNLSVYDLQHFDIVNAITTILKKYELSPTTFTVEVTESAMMANPEQAIEKLTLLDQMGLNISIDDYGTGYSSLSYLKKLPVDELKIDKSFVLQMDEDANDAIIVRSTIDLAHNLGLKVVAEGIENQHTLDILISLGCDTAQGFYLSRPMPAIDVEQWIVSYDNMTQLPP